MDGVDFLQDKRCIFAGLERNNGPNTYCNAVLQVLLSLLLLLMFGLIVYC